MVAGDFLRGECDGGFSKEVVEQRETAGIEHLESDVGSGLVGVQQEAWVFGMGFGV